MVLEASGAVYKLRDGVTYMCKTSTGSISVRLPENGYVNIIDMDGNATVSPVTVYPALGYSLMDGSINEDMLLDIAFGAFLFARAPYLKVWSVS